MIFLHTGCALRALLAVIYLSSTLANSYDLLASPTTQPIVTTSTPAPTQPTTRSPKTTPLTRRLTSTPGTTIKPLAYTAIVSSTGNQHVSKNSISGIFIECLNNPDGFKMAVQNCDSAPYIEHVVSRGNNDRTDPDIYFTIS
ncbi:hypothetical protein MAR_035230 [Mya arenaria]|uniref:Uncharacterized protein n=1 Tax=Mya arenaria TaxID=6604 RepID=A0ABY7EM15_MYAAR|nr:hypothetical protein MAR_035230 [Mya arenaria]